MIEYPVSLDLAASMDPDGEDWISGGDHGSIVSGITPEFGGDADALSPEEQYGLALINCYLATFRTLAERRDISYQGVDVDGSLTVDRDEDGMPWISRLDMVITVTHEEETTDLSAFHATVLEHCFIHRSVKTQIETELTVTTV